MSRPDILVCGATGTNGRALLGELARRGVPARAFVRGAEREAEIIAQGFEVARGDLAEPETIRRALGGISKLYIVTAIRPDTVTLFANAFEAAQAVGVQHVVKFSGFGSDPDSPSEVIRQHGESDAMLASSGLAYTLLRPNSFHQNMLWQAEAIRRERRFYLPLGSARQSTVDVRDLAEATARVLTEEGHTGRAYDLTGPESLSFEDVATAIADVIGEAVTYVPVPTDAAETAMRENGMPEWDARALAEVQGLFATGAYAEVRPDLAALLGRQPRRFADFARDQVDAFR